MGTGTLGIHDHRVDDEDDKDLENLDIEIPVLTPRVRDTRI